MPTELRIQRQRRLQQHLRARRAMLDGSALGLVVAESAGARDEHHGSRHHGGHVAGIVTGAADHFQGTEAERGRGAAHRRDAGRIEADPRRLPYTADVAAEAVPLKTVVRKRTDLAARTATFNGQWLNGSVSTAK